MMNCTHTTRLLPLFIGGDLSTQQTDSVRAHLFACRPCSELAAEYEANGSWLDSGGKPDLDEKFFEGLREAVWRDIRNDVSPASRWSRWRWSLAAVAVLLLCGMPLLARLGQPTLTSTEVARLVDEPGSRDTKLAEGVPESGSRITIVRRAARLSSIRSRQPSLAKHSIANAIAPVVMGRKESVEGEVAAAAAPITRRIEIQTADPSIRIIWLIPDRVLADQPQTTTDD